MSPLSIGSRYKLSVTFDSVPCGRALQLFGTKCFECWCLRASLPQSRRNTDANTSHETGSLYSHCTFHSLGKEEYCSQTSNKLGNMDYNTLSKNYFTKDVERTQWLGDWRKYHGSCGIEREAKLQEECLDLWYRGTMKMWVKLFTENSRKLGTLYNRQSAIQCQAAHLLTQGFLSHFGAPWAFFFCLSFIVCGYETRHEKLLQIFSVTLCCVWDYSFNVLISAYLQLSLAQLT